MKPPTPLEVVAALDVLRRFLGSAPTMPESDSYVDAAAAPVPQRTIRNAVRLGELEGSRVGGKLLVRRSELDRWIASHRVKVSKVEPSAALVALGARRVA